MRFAIALCLLLGSCCDNSLTQDSIPTEGSTEIESSLADGPKKKLSYAFLNNPYEFTNNDKFILTLDDTTVLSKAFEPSGEVELPEKMMNGRVRATLIINRDGKYYKFPNLRTCFIDHNSTVLNFVFLPSNERTENFLVIPSSESIL